MQRNCHEFIAYENLIGSRPRRSRGRQPGRCRRSADRAGRPLVRRALKVLSDREVSPQLGLLKSTLLQLDSTFSERTYGVGSFRDFAEKLAAAGHVAVREKGRNVVVELAEARRRTRVEAANRRPPPGPAPAARRAAARARARAEQQPRRPKPLPPASRGWPTASAKFAGCFRRRRSRPAGRCTCARRSSSCATSNRIRRAQVRLRQLVRICSAPGSVKGCSGSSATGRE